MYKIIAIPGIPDFVTDFKGLYDSFNLSQTTDSSNTEELITSILETMPPETIFRFIACEPGVLKQLEQEEFYSEFRALISNVLLIKTILHPVNHNLDALKFVTQLKEIDKTSLLKAIKSEDSNLFFEFCLKNAHKLDKEFITLVQEIAEHCPSKKELCETIQKAWIETQKTKPKKTHHYSDTELAERKQKQLEGLQREEKKIKARETETNRQQRSIEYNRFNMDLSSRLLFNKPADQLPANDLKALLHYMSILSDINKSSISTDSLNSAPVPVVSDESLTTFVLKCGDHNDIRLLLIQTQEHLVFAKCIKGHAALGGDGHGTYRGEFEKEVPTLLDSIKKYLEESPPVSPESASSSSPSPNQTPPNTPKRKRTKAKKDPVKEDPPSPIEQKRCPEVERAAPAPPKLKDPDPASVTQTPPTREELEEESKTKLSQFSGPIYPKDITIKKMKGLTLQYAFEFFDKSSSINILFTTPSKRGLTLEESRKLDTIQEDINQVQNLICAPIKELRQTLESLTKLGLTQESDKDSNASIFSLTQSKLQFDPSTVAYHEIIALLNKVNSLKPQINIILSQINLFDPIPCPQFERYLRYFLDTLIPQIRLKIDEAIIQYKQDYIKNDNGQNVETYPDKDISFEAAMQDGPTADLHYLQRVINTYHIYGKNTDIETYLNTIDLLTLSIDEIKTLQDLYTRHAATTDGIQASITRAINEVQDPLALSNIMSSTQLTPDHITLILEKLETTKTPPSANVLAILMNHYSDKTTFQTVRTYCYRHRHLIDPKQIETDDAYSLLCDFHYRDFRRNLASNLAFVPVLLAAPYMLTDDEITMASRNTALQYLVGTWAVRTTLSLAYNAKDYLLLQKRPIKKD